VLQSSLLAEVPVFGDEGLKGELPVLEYPASASAEAFRFAATALDLRKVRNGESDTSPTREPNTYLITSPGPQEGKTVVTANLALAAARKGRSVLAIDADFGHQRLTDLLRGDHEPGPGMTDIVEIGLDLVSGTFSLGPPGPLDLMSRGTRRTNAPDFFSLPAFQAFVAKVAQLYDVILIDGPPMLHVAYASILAQYVDRVLIVTRHGGSVARLEDLAQRLDLVGTPLAGYVYNGAPLRYEMTLTEGSLKDVLGERN
jgi:tyrosine-protein kinase Etk/Wzc